MIKLIQGDCLERMKEILDGSVDMVLADPPYGTTACKWDSIIPLEPMWGQLKRVIKHNGAIVMTASQPFTTTLIASNMKMFRYEWIWEKSRPTNQMLAKKQALKAHENILVFYKKQPIYNPQMWKGKKNHSTKDSETKQRYLNRISKYPANTSDVKYQRSVIKEKSLNPAQQIHPTQKPVALMEYLIKTYTNEDETILDFCMGSGTTGVACKNLDRHFIGIELNKTYFNMAQKRINESMCQEKLSL